MGPTPTLRSSTFYDLPSHFPGHPLALSHAAPSTAGNAQCSAASRSRASRRLALLPPQQLQPQRLARVTAVEGLNFRLGPNRAARERFPARNPLSPKRPPKLLRNSFAIPP
eukprot:6261955-Pyramimonas_sp.AAC.1